MDDYCIVHRAVQRIFMCNICDVECSVSKGPNALLHTQVQQLILDSKSFSLPDFYMISNLVLLSATSGGFRFFLYNLRIFFCNFRDLNPALNISALAHCFPTTVKTIWFHLISTLSDRCE